MKIYAHYINYSSILLVLVLINSSVATATNDVSIASNSGVVGDNNVVHQHFNQYNCNCNCTDNIPTPPTTISQPSPSQQPIKHPTLPTEQLHAFELNWIYSIYLYLNKYVAQNIYAQVGILIGGVATIISRINQFFIFCDRVERNIKYFKLICSYIWSFLKWPFCRIWFLFTWIWSLSIGLLYNKQTLIKKYRTVARFDFPHQTSL